MRVYVAVALVFTALSGSSVAQRRMESGSLPLHIAVIERWADNRLDSLLLAGQNVNSTDSAGDTPLHLAALETDSRLIKWLLLHGANPNYRDTNGWTPLHFAWGERPYSSYWFCPVGELLLSPFKYQDPATGRTVDTSLTSFAARDVIRATAFSLLLKAGAKPNITDRFGATALHFVNSNPRYSKFSASLLVPLTDPRLADSSGRTILMYLAADSSYLDLVLNVLRRIRYQDDADHQGHTALYFAARTGSVLMVQALLDAGADINARNKPIFAAVASRSVEMVRFFLDHGANPNPPMRYNQTLARSLKYEPDYKSQAIRQLLLSRGGSDTPSP